jgi:YVTN family beta-propeller protein
MGSNNVSVINGSPNTGTTSTVTATVQDTAASSPVAVAVNPETNQIYVANSGSSNTTIINGANNVVTDVGTNAGTSTFTSVAVDTSTNQAYVANSGNGTVTIINGNTFAVTTQLTAQAQTGQIAVNPVTHKAYAADFTSGGQVPITVIDGATNTVQQLTPPNQAPAAVAVNPVTNLIYVANSASNNVSVINGSTNTLQTTVATDANPAAIVVDPVNNLVYVANSGGGDITVIDSQFSTSTITFSQAISPNELAFNPVLNMVYGATSQASGLAFQFYSADGDQYIYPNTLVVGTDITAVAVNPAQGYNVYVVATVPGAMVPTPGIQVFDSHGGFTTSTCDAPAIPDAMDVNATTNTIYVACSDGTIDIYQQPDSFNAGNLLTLVPTPGRGAAVAVNAVTNTAYVADSGSSNVYVITGASPAIVTIPVVSPVAIAVNVATNKIYVVSQGNTPNVTIIDGATNTILGTIPLTGPGSLTEEIAVNPATGNIYALDSEANAIDVITENAVRSNALQTTINPLPSISGLPPNSTNTTAPTFTFSATNHLSFSTPTVNAPVTGVYFQVDTQQGQWTAATYSSVSGGVYSFTGAASGITPGFHILYAYATDGEDGAAGNSGAYSAQNGPLVGAITYYGFLVSPPIATINFYPLDFGNIPVGGMSPSPYPILINEGGSSMTYSYTITGPNASEFIVNPGQSSCVPSGTLSANSSCVIYVTFQPTTTGLATATLTWTDDSLGISNSTQSIGFVGNDDTAFSNLTPSQSIPAGTNSINLSGTISAPGSYPPSGETVYITINSTTQNATIGTNGAFSTAFNTSAIPSSATPYTITYYYQGDGNYSYASNNSTTLTVNSSGPTFSATVTLTGSGTGAVTDNQGPQISCSETNGGPQTGTCSGNYAPGTVVTLTAIPTDPSSFLFWGGACSPFGAGNSCTLTMNSNQNLTAQFSAGPAPAVTSVKSITADAVYGQLGSFTTSVSNNGGLSATSLYQPDGVVVDKSGNLYVADLQNSRVLFYPAGSTTATRVYGQGGSFSTGTQNASGINANSLNNPVGLALDSSGNLYVADWNNNRVLFYPAGSTTATRVYGQGGLFSTNSANNGGVSAASLNGPQSVALDSNSNLYVADTYNNRVLFYPSGSTTATQVYGQGGSFTTSTANNGGVSATSLNNPYGVALDSGGNLYVADYNNNRVLFYPPANTTATQVYGQLGSFAANTANNGGVSATSLDSPVAVALDSSSNLYVADYNNNRVLFYPPASTSTTATNVYGQGGSFTTDNAHTTANGLSNPAALALDSSGNLYVADKSSNRVLNYGSFSNVNVCPVGQNTPAPCTRTISLNYYLAATTTFGAIQVVTQGVPNLDFTLAGGSTCTGTVSGLSTCTVNVQFDPLAPGLRMGAVQLFDNLNNLLATTLVQGIGQGPAIAFGPGIQTTVPATGLGTPSDVKVDAAGDVFIVDGNNNRVVEVPASGPQITVFTGNFALTNPRGVAVDGAGDVFIADYGNNRVVEVPAGGGVQTTVGNGLSLPYAVAVDGAGNVFIADYGNHRVVKVTPSGVQTTVPTSGTICPQGLAVDGAGDIFISDSCTLPLVLEVAPGGIQSTLSFSSLEFPWGLAVDGAGDVFIADSELSQVEELPAGCASSACQITVGSGLLNPRGMAVDGVGDVFIADFSNSRVLEVNRSQPPTLSFAPTVEGNTSADSPKSVTAQNIGNQSLNAVAPGLTVGTNFTKVAGSGTPADCTSSFSLAAGASCNLSIDFVPTVAGPISSAAVFTDNALNTSPSAMQSITLTSTGVVPTPTPLEGPANPSYTTTSTFSFMDSEAGVTFQCSLDSAPFTACLAGITYSSLSEGPHTWSVEAVDASANASAPFTFNWTIVPSQVTVFLAGTGGGTVTSSPSGISCPSACFDQFDGVMVTLTATPNAGSVFTGWSVVGGSCQGTGTCTVNTASSFQSVTATFTLLTSFTLNVTELGTGTGQVTYGPPPQFTCSEANGLPETGTCSASYTSGTPVTLTATPTAPTTFGGWGGACASSGTSLTCNLTISSSENVTANFVPAPKSVNLSFPVGTNPPPQEAIFDCPSNTNPCTDPSAHALQLTIPNVSATVGVTVLATEVPPSQADGLCESGNTVLNDFDCRFVTFFSDGTNASNNVIVPLCDPYANGNCVHYLVYSTTGGPGVEPPASSYSGGVYWQITWNNESFTPPAPYWSGSTPQLYDDPDYAVTPTSAVGTSCSQPMTINGVNQSYSCQFEFNITEFYNPTQTVDSGIGGSTKQFNDVVVAFPPTVAGTNPVVQPPTPSIPAIAVTCLTGCSITGTTINFTVGTGGTFQAVPTGYPAPTLTESGTLPNGLTINPLTGIVGGTPAPGSNNTYTVSFTATNSVNHVTQIYSLVVSPAPPPPNFTVTVTELGTGTGQVIDGQNLDCMEANGITTGTCSGTYVGGSMITFTANPTAPTTFGGWGGACASSGTSLACTLTVNSSQNVTANFVPPPTTVPLSFPVGTNPPPQEAVFNCPSHTNPCTDPSAHALQLTIPNVSTAVGVTVLATEVPPSQANGLCGSTNSVTNDFDCRFVTFFSDGTNASNNVIVPLCDPYANGNCVHYLVYSTTGGPGVEPPASSYSGGVYWQITWNNESFTPPAPYWSGSTPQLYDDPDYAVTPTSAVGTSCTQPMTINGVNQSYSCQFEFNITEFYNPTQTVDSGIGGSTKQFNDVVVAFPPTVAGTGTVVQPPPTPSTPAITATCLTGCSITGTTINFTIGSGGTFQALPTGYPAPTLTETGALPNGLTLNKLTGIVGGTPTGTSGMFPISFTATNSKGATTQSYTLTVKAAAASKLVFTTSPVTVTAGSCSTVITAQSQDSNGNPSDPASTETLALSTSGSGGSFYSNSTCTTSITSVSIPTSANTASFYWKDTTAGSPVITASGTGAFSSAPTQAETVKAAAASKLVFTTSPVTVTAGSCSTVITAQSQDSNGNPSDPASTETLALSTSGSGGSFYSNSTCTTSITSVSIPTSANTASFYWKDTTAGSPVITASGTGAFSSAPTQAETVKAAAASKLVFTTSPVTVTAGVASGTITVQRQDQYGNANTTDATRTVTLSSSSTGTVTFTPASLSIASGSSSASFTYTDTKAGTPTITAASTSPTTITSASQQETVNAAAATLKIAPTSLNFGTVYYDQIGVQFVTLTNTGTTPITISSVKITTPGNAIADFGEITVCLPFIPSMPGTLQPGKTCTIAVGFLDASKIFSPTASTATIAITDNAAGSPQLIPLSLTVINPQASLGASSLSFATQKVGTTSASKTVMLTNTGNTPLTLGTLTVSGNFALVSGSGTTCSNNGTVAAGASCAINVTFKPTAKGNNTGSVKITDNALNSPQSISLSGTGN